MSSPASPGQPGGLPEGDMPGMQMGPGGAPATGAPDGSGAAAMPMAPAASRPEIVAVGVLSLVLLAAGVLLASLFGDFRMSRGSMGEMAGMSGTGGMAGMSGMGGAGGVTQMGGLVMPPGMIMAPGMDPQAQADMAAVDLAKIRYTAPADARGDQVLPARVENGVKVFDLETSLIRWNILPDVQVAAYAFNRQVPGPRIVITQGDRVRINVRNNLPDPTSVHWHGLILPNEMDGAADVTQPPIQPGESFTYEFTVQQAGSYVYHSHFAPDRQQALGLYGALIVEPKAPPPAPAYDKEVVIQLQEWTVKQGYTFPSMPMEGLLPNFFTINGKSYPSTETVQMKVGERLRVRFIGSNTAFIHPMHIHGGPFTIVETDGNPVPPAAQFQKDTINIGPGERYDVIWEARLPGKWLIHCHINHHITNDGKEEQGGGGLTMVINVAPS
ncbi:MAG: copper oxidase [Chloroflexi bacterium]|nr:copper oxidase [Chloroflexota bacterium]